jgi:hypothetical protein
MSLQVRCPNCDLDEAQAYSMCSRCGLRFAHTLAVVSLPSLEAPSNLASFVTARGSMADPNVGTAAACFEPKRPSLRDPPLEAEAGPRPRV